MGESLPPTDKGYNSLEEGWAQIKLVALDPLEVDIIKKYSI